MILLVTRDFTKASHFPRNAFPPLPFCAITGLSLKLTFSSGSRLLVTTFLNSPAASLLHFAPLGHNRPPKGWDLLVRLVPKWLPGVRYIWIYTYSEHTTSRRAGTCPSLVPIPSPLWGALETLLYPGVGVPGLRGRNERKVPEWRGLARLRRKQAPPSPLGTWAKGGPPGR